ncbi:hypothetical protein HK104_001966 [Borealophlyctis nickersoniae]|nr:hypothetical protein HK104_001966 [Borealophlyctis nickersoniae]
MYVNISSIVGTAEGRIFMKGRGSRGELYELLYQAEDGWFSRNLSISSDSDRSDTTYRTYGLNARHIYKVARTRRWFDNADVGCVAIRYASGKCVVFPGPNDRTRRTAEALNAEAIIFFATDAIETTIDLASSEGRRDLLLQPEKEGLLLQQEKVLAVWADHTDTLLTDAAVFENRIMTTVRNWNGTFQVMDVEGDVEADGATAVTAKRGTLHPVMNSLAFCVSLLTGGLLIRTLLMEIAADGNWAQAHAIWCDIDNPPPNDGGITSPEKASNLNFALQFSMKVHDAMNAIDPMRRLNPEQEGPGVIFVLILDSDSRIPEDCMLDAASEMAESPEGGGFWESGMAHFTKTIHLAILYACAVGDIAPFVGQTAFLRCSAIKQVAFEEDNEIKLWSESHVSEDFDMALRLQIQGYVVRYASYSNGQFQEGTLGAAWLLTLINYIAWGWFPYDVDHFLLADFEIFISVTFLFGITSPIINAVYRYRSGTSTLLYALYDNFKWVFFFTLFFSGISMHVSFVLLGYFVGYNVRFGVTKKEVENESFLVSLGKIICNYWPMYLLSLRITAGILFLYQWSNVDWNIPSTVMIVAPLVMFLSHILAPILLNPSTTAVNR